MTLAQTTLGTQLEQLKKYTRVVADTGDFESIKRFSPLDATTNPTLIYRAVCMDEYAHLLERAATEAESSRLHGADLVNHVIDRLLVIFGSEILKVIPGRVSTEVDARLSFDTAATVEKARAIIALYEAKGIDRERVLVKIASTWEGLQAARILEAESIHCNMTLLFSLVQAIQAAESGATLISPFVGRIMDWYQAKTGKTFTANEDPGVQSVVQIYHYLKHFDYSTEIMGASFRNKGEILALAGCDLLTISPELLHELEESSDPVERQLSVEDAHREPIQRIELDEASFRWHINEDPMATEKLADGIRRFAQDTEKLADLIGQEILD